MKSHINENAKEIKILFISLAHSSHTISWINLFDEKNVDYFLFGVDGTYTDYFPSTRVYRYQETALERRIRLIKSKLRLINNEESYLENCELSYLKKLILRIRPNIIHTLGFEPAGYDFLKIFSQLKRSHDFSWVHTARGGPEMVFNKTNNFERIKRILINCDFFIADNYQNYQYALEIGLKEEKKFERLVPGTGGIDLELIKRRKIPTINSRVIIFPKAYECIVSKALPVFEALKNCWDEIQPCTVIFTAVSEETRIWLSELPSYMRASFVIYDRVPREKLLDLYLEARVLIAPSLLDGIPNVLYEAMATGVVPIVSPIETLIDIFKNEENVIYARNLYINEIQEAITILMNDDLLVDKIVRNNLLMVKELADKSLIQDEFIKFYNRIVSIN